MAQLPLYNLNGEQSGQVEVSDKIFACPENKTLVHSCLVWFLAAKRRGTHSSLKRGEVSGGGKKPWKQKGTGRARAGSTRSPLWRKGGVVFGPKPRDYNFNFPKKMRQQALCAVLSDKAKNNKIKIVDELTLAQPKTKLAYGLLAKLAVVPKGLVLLPKENEIFAKAAGNIKGVAVVSQDDLNIFNLLKQDCLLIERKALDRLVEVLK